MVDWKVNGALRRRTKGFQGIRARNKMPRQVGRRTPCAPFYAGQTTARTE